MWHSKYGVWRGWIDQPTRVPADSQLEPVTGPIQAGDRTVQPGTRLRGSGPGRAPLAGEAEPLLEALEHQGRDQRLDVAAVPADLLDQAGPQEAVHGVGRDEQRLDLGETVVHLGHLHLVLEVADRPQALHDRLDPVDPAKLDQQPPERPDLDILQAGGHVAEHLDPFLNCEQAVLGLVGTHHHQHLVVQQRRPADDVEVTAGHRGEGAWTDDTTHAVPPFRHYICAAHHGNSVNSAVDWAPAARPYQN